MTKPIPLPLVLIGGGGHASVLADVLASQGREIVAVISPNEISNRNLRSISTRISSDNEILRFKPNEVSLINGIGMRPYSNIRELINKKFIGLGYRFETVVANTAYVSSSAILQEGVQVLQNCVINAGAFIDEHSIINSGAIIEHDCEIGSYNHVAPRATLCGQVKSENGVFFGACSVVLPGCIIGKQSVIGAGAILNHDLSANSIIYPAPSVVSKITKRD